MASGPYTAWSRGRLTFRPCVPLLILSHRAGLRAVPELVPGPWSWPGTLPEGFPPPSLSLRHGHRGSCPRLDRATPPSAVHALTLLRVRPARAGGSVVPAAAGPVLSTDTWGSVGVCRTSGDSRAGVRDACQRGGGRALRTSVNGAGMGPMLPIPITYNEPL